MAGTITLNLSLDLQIYFALMKSPRGDEKIRHFFVCVSLIMLIKYCAGNSFGSSAFGRKVPQSEIYYLLFVK